MARWWDTDMASASQVLYTDPSMAFDVASTPDSAFARNVMNYTAQQQDVDRQQVQKERSGFLGTLADWYSNTDKFLMDIPGVNVGWMVTKAVGMGMWYPVDKLAQGAHWLYSEGVSQPLSTLMLQEGKAMLGDPGALFEADEWSEAYGQAETISPGRVAANVGAATGTIARESGGLPFFQQRSEDSNRRVERMINDSEYWRDKAGWTYTAGTGAADFALVMGADPTTYLLGGAGQVVKGVRSVQLATKGGELVRTRGAIADAVRASVGKRPETVEEVSKGRQMQDFFNWVHEPSVVSSADRKTALEIESHPIWGRGRRQNPFKSQYSQVLSKWAREDMELGWRFMAGDNRTVAPLMERGGSILDDIGRLSENRVAVDSARLDPTLVGYFASIEARRPTIAPAGLDLSLPQTRQTALNEEVGRFMYKVEGVTDPSMVDVAKIGQWKSDKLALIDGEMRILSDQESTLRRLLGSNLGREAEDFKAVEATGFGGLPRSYRMGSGSFTSTYNDAERAAANKLKDRRGRLTTEGYRGGFYGTPLRIVQSFNDRVPQGFVNHNEPDAGERVYEMLREVPALGPDRRQSLMSQYMVAGDKVAKSRALQSIHAQVIEHMATNVHGLDGEVARVISGMTEAKIGETVNKLLNVTGKNFGSTKQAYSGAKDSSGRFVDHVEDGEGWALAPLAKTQLSQADALIPVREIERALGRVSGSAQRIRKAGGSAADAARISADSLNGIWKAATLLRPAYVPRMVSDELATAAIKFGFMSRIIADGGVGTKNLVLNRVSHIQAVRGKGSYTPTTGEGMGKSIVKIDDPEAIKAVRQQRARLQAELAKEANPLKREQIKGTLKELKVSKIRVSDALPVVNVRLSMERELLTNLERDLADYQARYARTQASLRQPPSLGSGPGSSAWTRMGDSLTRYQDKMHDIQLRIDDHKQVIKEFQDYHNEIYRTALASSGRRLGEGEFEVAGYGLVPQAFSGEWVNPISRDQISSHSAMSTMYARAESIDTQRMIQSGSWEHIGPDKPNHMQSWLHALNRQIRQDELFVKVMEDPTGKAASNWLKTPDGVQHIKDLGIRARNVSGLIDDIGLTLDKYLPADTGLRQKLINGEDVTEADLVSAIAKSDFPIVHGQEILEKTALSAKDSVGNIIDRIIEKGFKRLGSIPSDVISRHPTYLHFQEGRFKELMKTELAYRRSVGKGADLDPSDLQKMLERSDQLARKDMSQLVYDPNRTTASEALRFVAPFFSAHADSLARWGGLIAEKPRLAGRIAQIYNAPVSAGMVTDQYGNKVGGDGYVSIVDPSTIKYDEDGAPIPNSGKVIGREFVTMENRVLHFRAPWSSKSAGTTPIKISAMNTILPGDPWWNPGSGPLVQVTGSQLAKASPQVGDFLQWAKILPYGPTDTSTALTPKYMRAIFDAWKGDDPDNEEYQKAYVAIWNKKQMEYHLSGGEAKFSQKDIQEEARQFLYLNVLEAWGSPAQSSNTPLTGSPYQFFVDQLGQMRKADPENYRDNFLAKFGTDYGGFTASLTKSMGIAATISADQQAEKYRDQISADPDMAQFWVGDIYNGGPFSSSVYQKQLDDNFGSRRARERITAEEAIEQSQVERGWYEYRTAKAYIDSLLIRNGFTSYTQKGAEGYNDAKRQLTAGISAKYPAWNTAFSTVDRSKIPNRIRSFEMAIQDEKLMSDPMRHEMPSLVRYLQGRREFKAALQQRGLSKLSYNVKGEPIGQSADIGQAWERFKMGLINENVAFGDLHNRYLTNDDLQ